jgi:VWFA-related protein
MSSTGQRKSARYLAPLAAFAAALVAVAVAHGQDASLRSTIASVSELPYPDAQAVVNVEDTSGASLQGLNASNFTVTVGGAPAVVSKAELASSDSIPLDVLLLIDTSGSTAGEALAQSKNAAEAFVRGLAPEDRVAIMRFANSVTVQQDFTTDRAAAIAAINGLQSTGQTEIYKATAAAVSQAATSTSPRRALILLTDGAQDAIVTDVTREGALAAARSASVPVFTIAQGAAIEDSSFLIDLASISNGAYLEAPTPGALTGVYQGIGRLLQNQYIVTFDASSAAGQVDAPIKVQVSASGRTSSATSTFTPSGAFLAPAITIFGLAAGDALEEMRDITATSEGAQPITKAAFYVDNVNVFEATSAPFTFSYDPDLFTEGEHTLRISVTIGGKIVDGAALTFSSVPAAPVAPGGAENSRGGGGLPILPIAGIVGVLAVIGGGFLVVQRVRQVSGPSLAIASADQRITPWATQHRSITTPSADDESAAPSATIMPPVAEEVGEPLGVLIACAGTDAGRQYPVGGQPVRIGSGSQCAVRINDPRLATEEARIWIKKDNLMVHRLTRLTSIAHDGVSGGWTMMDPGETLQIGDHIFEFRLLPEGAPLPDREAAPAAPRSGDTTNIFRDKGAPPAPALPQPGMASTKPDAGPPPATEADPQTSPTDAPPRRLTEMMPREMGFPHEGNDQPEQQAS